ncbi:M14 family zinc carboxypeptidase [Deinococcus enclensis]|uniref:PKD repeat protein n=1 Tax=Deinococcus enclensis TaxID=1049582 RepID=A0ABT9M7U7_9DEIO|nr:M14 family zinc carboxypeptidase [Deinococcus enclensis]MDP9762653.1 PKD repeat protein [Deinococcus enclensis]
MHKRPLSVLMLSLGLLLPACGTTPQGAPTQAPAAGSIVATPDECATFDQYPMVVARVAFNTERDFYDLATTFEFLGGTLEDRYVLLDLSKKEYEQLKVTGLTRGWKVEIDPTATKRESAALDIVAAGGTVKNELSAQSIPGYSCYRTVEETYQTMDQLAAQYPNLVTVKSIGPTWLKSRGTGGYDVKVIIIGNKNNTSTNKPKVVMTSSIHAREYTPAELHTRLAEYLLTNYGKDADVTWMLDSQEVHLVLQANPDGRKKAEAGASWRKNVNNTSGCSTSAYGTDLNRNFNTFWGQGGSSTDPCNETYMGRSAASEPEVQNIQNYLKSVFPDQRGPNLGDAASLDTMGVYMDTHSYSKLVLWSWGHTTTAAPNGTQLQSLGRKFAYFNGYKPQQAVGLYPTSGTTEDYGYGELGIASYTIELGSAFFESCSSFTSDVIPKNQPALLYAMKAARAPYRMGSGADVVNVSAPASVTAGSAFTLSARADSTRYNNTNGTEPGRAVTSAEYFVDRAPWEGGTAVPMTASDGSFNATAENITASVPTGGLSAGRHTIYVRAKNTSGNYGPVSAVFVTLGGTGGNVAPVASFTNTVSGLTANFTSTSTDSDGTIAGYSWNFGDGTTSTAQNPGKTYAAAGTYTVTLTVTDNAGATHSTSKAVTVSSGGTVTYSGSVTSGGTSYQPGTAGRSYAAGTLRATLSGPSGTDFDLYLQKYNGSTWADVASSESSSSSESITYTATSGTYRWEVYGYSGSGSYTLNVTAP